jgi:hypothetical protein
MTERGIRFHTPDVTTDVGSDEVAALREELKKIAATNPPRPDIANLLENLTLSERALGPEARRFEPSEGEAAILLRATDHLRNLGHSGELLRLRDRLRGGGGWIGYRVQYLGTRPDDNFTSYSGAYEPGDRLVTLTGHEFYVVEVNHDTDPQELVVDDWRAGAVVH